MPQEEEYNTIVGQNIYSFRVQRGISQQEIGKILKVTFQQVQKYETAKNRISAGKLKVLADYFKVSVGIFFDENEESFNFESVGTHISTIKNLIQLQKNDPALAAKINAIISQLNKKENSDA